MMKEAKILLYIVQKKDLKGEIHKSSFPAILFLDPPKPIGQNIPLTNSRQIPVSSTFLNWRIFESRYC